MRDIKFRALRNKTWYYFDFKDRNRWARELLETMAEDENLVEFDAFVEYTGLKDKNGKDIYEGDIIKLEWGNAEIMFEDGAFVLGIRDDCYRDMAGEDNNLYYEVIGNIYDNPKLI